MGKKRSKPAYQTNVSRKGRKRSLRKRNRKKMATSVSENNVRGLCSGLSSLGINSSKKPRATERFLIESGISSAFTDQRSRKKRISQRRVKRIYSMKSLLSALPESSPQENACGSSGSTFSIHGSRFPGKHVLLAAVGRKSSFLRPWA